MSPIGRLAVAAALAAATLADAPVALAAPGDMQYSIVVDHNPNGLLRTMRAGADFVKSRRGKRFRVVLAGAGVIGVIPGSSTIQLEYMKKIRGSGVEIIACKESMDALAKANKRRIPVLPGVSVQACQSLRNKMNVGGWQVAPGI